MPIHHRSRLFICALIVVAFIAPIPAPGGPGEAEPSATLPDPGRSPGEIKRVTISYNRDHPPFKFTDDEGRPAGLLIDLWRLWSEKTGIEVDFQDATWKDTLKLIRGGEADVHAGIFASEEREKFLDFSEPLLSIDYYIFSHRTILSVDVARELAAFRVGVPDGGYTHEFMGRNYPEVALATFTGYPDLYDAAGRGEIRVFVSPRPNFQHYLSLNNLANSYRTGPPLFRRKYRGAVQDGKSALMEELNRGISLITPEERAALESRWLGISRHRPGPEILFIAVCDRFQPYSFLDSDGRASGLLVDLWRLWADKTARRIAFRPSSWEESIRAVASGEADIHSALFKTEEREDQLDFSGPIYEITTKLFYRSEGPPIEGLDDLSGKRVGIVRGTWHEKFLRDYAPGAVTVPLDSSDEFILALKRGEVEACMMEVNATRIALSRLGLSGKIRESGEDIFTRTFHAGVREGETELAALVDQGFNAIPRDELAEVEQRWIPHTGKHYYTEPTELSPERGLVKLTGREKEWIREHPVIRLGIDPGFGPFEFLAPDGAYAGIASDYVELLNRRLCINMKVVPAANWSEVIARARKREIDVLPAVMVTEKRRQYMNFTRPYITSPEMIFTRKDAVFVGGIEDLSGKTVALKRQSYMQDRLQRRYPEIKLLLLETTEEALQAVTDGEAEAYINTLAHGTYIIEKNNYANLKVAAPVEGEIDGISFAIRQDWPELLTIISKGLASITPEEASAIRRRWISVRFEHGIDIKRILLWSILVGSVIVIVIAAIFFWNRSLSREIHRRRIVEDDLKIAKEQAEAADRLKSAFLATMSHELRTPLNSIIGFTGIVLQGLAGPLNQEQDKQLGMVRNSAHHLLELINDVLDISKIEAGQLKVDLRPFNLRESIEKAIQTVTPLADRKELALSSDIDSGIGVIISDRRRVEQVLINLINNAIKFTNAGAVSVHAGIIKSSDGLPETVSIQVTDTGIGIREEDLTSIFQSFHQLDSGLTRQNDGTGLGLAICKRLVEILGGEIKVESRWGAGSCFTVIFPVKPNADREVSDEEKNPGD